MQPVIFQEPLQLIDYVAAVFPAAICVFFLVLETTSENLQSMIFVALLITMIVGIVLGFSLRRTIVIGKTSINYKRYMYGEVAFRDIKHVMYANDYQGEIQIQPNRYLGLGAPNDAVLLDTTHGRYRFRTIHADAVMEELSKRLSS